MASRRSQRQYAFVLSVLGHAAIVVALTFSIPLTNRRPLGSDVEPIETYVIDQAALDAEIARLDAEKEAERLRREQEAERIRQEQLAEQRELERVQAEAEAAERAAEQRRIQLEREAEAEKLRIAEQQRLEAERLERERQAEEQRRQEQLAREREEAARRQREEEERRRREAIEAEIQESIAAERAAGAARESGARDQWALAIGRRVEQYWNRPPNVDPNLECVLAVIQLPDGSVTQVTVERCTTTDQTIIRSVENAVYNASPLPQRPSGVPFERQILITFRPAE